MANVTTAAKKTYQSSKSNQKYKEQKLGWIDRLSVGLLKKQDSIIKDKAHPPVSNLKRFFGYLFDFFLANVLACIPLVAIQSVVTGSTEVTQVLAGMELKWVYIITACVFIMYLIYYVMIPWKLWPGQTPAKRLLGYKIVMMDNSEVTLKALLLRNVIALTFLEGASFLITYVIQLVVLTAGIDYPQFFSYICYFMTMISILVTFTNYSRRMIHDYVGGTKEYQLERNNQNNRAL